MNNEDIEKSPNETASYEVKEEAKFYVVSSEKFWILTIASLGFYTLVYYFLNWEAYRNATRKDISPFWRTITFPYFVFDFRDKVKELCDEKDVKTGYEFDILPFAMVLTYVLSSLIVYKQTDSGSFHYGLFGAGMAISIFQSRFRKFINIASGDELGESNSKLSLENYFWLGLLWFLLILSLMFVKAKYL
ncbi:hypothetical protein [Pseudaquidulcibacter saccharophilus]|uniref:hypothetical protein n=1 Tax=Pseudaquidulcibacter saccharophilus TaxID=2831900 RepID=UPI001EFF2AA2|nr:hypothetical protein [Pseudaquidulcibacter saccharophilus]